MSGEEAVKNLRKYSFLQGKKIKYKDREPVLIENITIQPYGNSENGYVDDFFLIDNMNEEGNLPYGIYELIFVYYKQGRAKIFTLEQHLFHLEKVLD